MPAATFRFGRFLLDPENRQLSRDGAPIELSNRYFDALALLVREPDTLISKDRFLAEVWRGVPVTDEALTQCIKTLRRQLGDDAAAPRLIATVPKHGYRFIAPVKSSADSGADARPRRTWRQTLILGGAGTVGAGVAGLIGGLAYGFAAASRTLEAGSGAISLLLVVLLVTMAMAVIGGLGVAFGIAASEQVARPPWRLAIIGGALGGLAVGGVTKMLGLDAFNLLLGKAPGDFTGPLEGLVLGGGVGLGAWLAFRGRAPTPRRCAAVAALGGGAAGAVVPLLGGRLMGGSLDLLASAFPESRLRLGEVGQLFGEDGFGPTTQLITGALEGALFAGCIVGAMAIARRDLGQSFPNGAEPVNG